MKALGTGFVTRVSGRAIEVVRRHRPRNEVPRWRRSTFRGSSAQPWSHLPLHTRETRHAHVLLVWRRPSSTHST